MEVLFAINLPVTNVHVNVAQMNSAALNLMTLQTDVVYVIDVNRNSIR